MNWLIMKIIIGIMLAPVFAVGRQLQSLALLGQKKITGKS
jgi:hypothetical protein